jgi:hypothetical protein
MVFDTELIKCKKIYSGIVELEPILCIFVVIYNSVTYSVTNHKLKF